MPRNNRLLWRISAGAVMVLAACVLAIAAEAPHGWFMAGSKPAEYESGVEVDQAYQGHASAFLKSKKATIDGFGTLMQSISTEQYAGKRVRLSGLVKSKEVKGWAGLWARVDQGQNMVAFDNMQDRAITGTTDWQRYDVVLDVPKEATGISFGILLSGTGEVWLNSTKFEVVGPEVPVTSHGDRKVQDKPVNLDFSE